MVFKTSKVAIKVSMDAYRFVKSSGMQLQFMLPIIIMFYMRRAVGCYYACLQ